MIIENSYIAQKIRIALLVIPLWLSVLGIKAQTYINGPLSNSTLAPGTYYNNSSIVMSPGFSISGSTGSYTFFINSDCALLATMPSTSQNFIMTSIPRIPAYAPGNTGYTSCDVMQNVQYFDGLGRPLQTVQVKGSAQNSDVVAPNAYDEFGREATKYLPYAFQGTADGSYKSDALTTSATSQAGFYASPPTGVSAISNPSALTNFEPSPLNRTIEEGAPGAAWQPVTGSTAGHTVKVVYTNSNATALTDTANSRLVMLYRVTVNSDNSRTLTNSGYYPSGQLYVTISKNENWTSGRGGTTEEYKDKEGHVVLKRTFNYTGGVLQFLSTYYVYDDLDNLAYVLPPGSGADTAQPSQTILNSLCYQYSYDERNRLMTKRVPGKGVEEMVYNLLDQVIFSRDANELSLNEWAFTKYDPMGRVIMTGVNTSNTSTRAALQSYVTNTLSSGTYQEWETPTPGSGVQGYSNNAFPNGSTGVVPLVVNYFDDYTFQGQPSTVVAQTGSSLMTKGLQTATKTAVLNTMNNTTPDMLWTVRYYDDLGRLTQNYLQHYLGGVLNANNYDVETTTYNFSNQPVTTLRKHYNSTSTSAPILTIANTYNYDHIGRKTQTFEQINGGTNVLVSQVDYNEIGQVLTRHLHSTNNGSSFLQNIGYTYNERGWLLTSTAPLFSMQLEYNANPNSITGFDAQYNGNIASQIWTTSGFATKNYVYAYDTQNRLTSGISSDNYNESGISYDLNGNILALKRTFSSSAPIDNLTYTYNGTNQIQGITDAAPDNSIYGYRPGTYSGYQYDPNGNMSVLPTPPNGQAVANINIGYNLLNLPQTITGGKIITYTYDAEGNKLRRVSPNTGSTDYINGIQYDQSSGATAPTISFVQTEEGKATSLSAGGFDYTYYLGDNLGNTRVTFDTKTGAVVIQQQDDYFPFGYEISRGTIPSPKNEYLYNKKELQEELVQFDYGARFYDPVIGRWTSIDPMAEEDRRTTPYGYTFDDPIRHTDPDGMFGEDANGEDDGGDCCRTAKMVMGTGLIVAGGEIAVAAPTFVGEAVAVPAAVLTVGVTAVAAGGTLIYDALFGSHSNNSTPPLEKSPPNPNGSKGKPDHQEKVKDLARKAEAEKQPGDKVLTEKKLQGHDSNRRPDVQVVNEKGKAKKVYEAERKPNSTRNKKREAEYKKLDIDNETHPVENK